MAKYETKVKFFDNESPLRGRNAVMYYAYSEDTKDKPLCINTTDSEGNSLGQVVLPVESLKKFLSRIGRL